MVRVDVTGCVPVIAGGSAIEHAGVSIAPAGPPLTAQENLMLPVNPSLGVTVITDVPFAPGAGMLIAFPVTVKSGVAAFPVTLKGTGTVALTVPDVPATVTM